MADVSASASLVPARPRLRGDLRALSTDGGLLLRGGATAVALQGATVSALLPDLLYRLDGTRTVEALMQELPHVAPDVLVGALRVLAEQDLLDDENGDPEHSTTGLAAQIRYWGSLERGGAALQDRLTSGTVAVVGTGLVADALDNALSHAGIGAVERVARTDDVPGGDRSVVVVLATDTPQRDELDRVNRDCVKRDVRWLPAVLGADHATVGPFVVPRVTACHECFRLRLAANSSVLDDARGDYVAAGGRRLVSAPAHLVLMVSALAAGEVVVALTEAGRPRTYGAFLSLRPLLSGTAVHEVLRLPRCPVCGPHRYLPQAKIWDLTADEAQS